MTDQNGFGSGAPANLTWQNDASAYTFGQIFRVTTSGLSAIKIRFYLPAGSPNGVGSGYQVALYEVPTTTPIATAGPTSFVTGWNEVTIPTTALTSGQDYMAAVLAPNGYYGADTVLFASGNYDPPNDLLFLSAGKFHAGSSLTYPTDAFGTPWYGVDVTVSDGAGGSNDGTISAASDATTASFTGTIENNGTISAAGDATTASLTGTANNDGTLSVTGDATTASFAGTVPIDGTINVVGNATTASFTGTGPVAAASSTRISRLLARLWFTETIGLERLEGNGAYGPTFANSVSLGGAIDHGSKEIMTPTGDTRISSARVFLPVETDAVPLGSRVTLPDAHGAGTFQVVAVNLHRSGQATPDHLELALL